MRPIAFVSLLLLLSGCTGSLSELRSLAPAPDDFSSALAAEYLAYSEAELEQGRGQAADHFAAKGVEAAKTRIVPPDAAKGAELEAARAALVVVLTDDVKHVAPQKAARAQLLFECWNAQEPKKQPSRPVSCADSFAVAMEELQAVADSLIHGKAKKHRKRHAHIDNSKKVYLSNDKESDQDAQ